MKSELIPGIDRFEGIRDFENLDKMTYDEWIKDLEKNWAVGTRNWNNVKNQIIQLFGDRILKYYVDDTGGDT